MTTLPASVDGFDGLVVHLASHDLTLCPVSRAPIAALPAYKRRMGWSFPWASFDYNCRSKDTTWLREGGPVLEHAAMIGAGYFGA